MAFRTNRPTGGLVGSVFSDDTDPVENLLDTISHQLDGGEGWVQRRPGRLTWHAARLALKLTAVDGAAGPVLLADVEVVRDVKHAGFELLDRLNHLNAHAAGWWFWFDEDGGSVRSSARCPVIRESWWWCWLYMVGLQHQFTVAESIADELASLAGGSVSQMPHPERGARPDVDGWLLGVRLGPREPSASVSGFITALDHAQIDHSFEEVDDLVVRQRSPLDVWLFDTRGRAQHRCSQHWHPEHGWGWQFISLATDYNDVVVESAPADCEAENLVTKAAELNAELAFESPNRPVFGGWVAMPGLGLVHHTFIPAHVGEYIVSDSMASFGYVLSLMVDQLARTGPEPIAPARSDIDPQNMNDLVQDWSDAVHLRIGFLGWAYTVDRDHQPDFEPGLDDDDGESLWTVPKLICVCSFGIFNPAGPTVSSLEVALDGLQYSLYCAARHPFLPRVELLGSVPIDQTDAMSELISRSLSRMDDNPLGSGPDWLDIRSALYTDAVLEGVRQFARRSDTDLGLTADLLLKYSSDPWARLGLDDGPAERSERGMNNPIDYWVDTITDPDVIAGHQLFIRSAWEGAKEYQSNGPEAAMSAQRTVMYSPRERAMCDFEFRGQTGSLVQHPIL